MTTHVVIYYKYEGWQNHVGSRFFIPYKGGNSDTLIAPRSAPNQFTCSVKMRQVVAWKVMKQYQSLDHLFKCRHIVKHIKIWVSILRLKCTARNWRQNRVKIDTTWKEIEPKREFKLSPSLCTQERKSLCNTKGKLINLIIYLFYFYTSKELINHID